MKKSFCIHPKALVESKQIAPGTKIWAFVHVLSSAVIGRNCNIGDHCYIEGEVTIGNEVVIKNGVSIWKGITIEDRVFVGPNVAFTNDLLPRAKIFRIDYDELLIKEGASIGANATIVAPVVIGRYAMIGAGSVVTKDVPNFALVYGNPAQIHGWVCKCGKRLDLQREENKGAVCECGLKYVKEGPQISRVRPSRPTGQAQIKMGALPVSQELSTTRRSLPSSF